MVKIKTHGKCLVCTLIKNDFPLTARNYVDGLCNEWSSHRRDHLHNKVWHDDVWYTSSLRLSEVVKEWEKSNDI